MSAQSPGTTLTSTICTVAAPVPSVKPAGGEAMVSVKRSGPSMVVSEGMTTLKETEVWFAGRATGQGPPDQSPEVAVPAVALTVKVALEEEALAAVSVACRVVPSRTLEWARSKPTAIAAVLPATLKTGDIP